MRSSVTPHTSSPHLVEVTNGEEEEDSVFECDESDSKHSENCEECRKKLQGALTDTLPTKVADGESGINRFYYRCLTLTDASQSQSFNKYWLRH